MSAAKPRTGAAAPSIGPSAGWMAGHSMRAVKAITKLGETAQSESVQLRAMRAVLHDHMAVAKLSNMEYRISAIEENIRIRKETENGQR